MHEPPVRARHRDPPRRGRRRRGPAAAGSGPGNAEDSKRAGRRGAGTRCLCGRAAGRRPHAGNQYDVLTNGDQFLPAMLQAIAAARTRIVLETYIYDSGDVAARFTTALEQAARRGVMCAIVVDAVGSSGMERGHVQRLESAGCVVATFNPPHWYKLEELNYRSHRKILVVDGEVGFTGGAGSPTTRGTRAGPRPLARHPDPVARADRAPARGGLLRELQRGARPGHPRRRRAIQSHRRRRTFDADSQLADRRQQRSQAPLLARGGVRPSQPRHHQPVFRDRRIHDVGAGRRGHARRPHPSARRGRDHRRDAP